MANANGNGRLTPAQQAREEKKRLKRAKRLARKFITAKNTSTKRIRIDT